MFLDLIRARRSVRKFTSRPIDENTRAQILEAALRSPSSRGLNPWRFIAVDDPKLLDRLSRSKPHGASFLKNAPLGIVVCADTTISDVCVEDAAIASTFIHLAAADLGLGSCWRFCCKKYFQDKEIVQA
ncbi:MAG: nitroreductase family protein [Desulfobacter sp.]|nr:nitroreductase family protein [Desulfobacter sp.]WDP85993.1 MAG: nitroreductase family protein [Desulfobacter sp.]